MINGFVIDLFNETNEPVSFSLLAINEEFIGGGISTDNDRICKVTFFKDSIPQSLVFNKILDNTEINIDGLANYVTLVIPPFSKSIIQLLPTFK